MGLTTARGESKGEKEKGEMGCVGRKGPRGFRKNK
jgi:hypothetical protein